MLHHLLMIMSARAGVIFQMNLNTIQLVY